MKGHPYMNLQLFAADGGEPDGAVKTPEQPSGGQQPGEIPKTTYDEAELNRIADERAERARKSAIKSYAEQQGLTPEQVQDILADHKTRKEAELTDLQKAQQAVQNEAAKAAQKDAEISALRGQMEALALGVKPDATSDVLALAMLREGAKDDIKAAIAAIVAQYPHFKTTAPPQNTTQMPNPAGGSPVAGTPKDYEQRYAQAVKANDQALRIHIKSEAAQKGIYLR